MQQHVYDPIDDITISYSSVLILTFSTGPSSDPNISSVLITLLLYKVVTWCACWTASWYVISVAKKEGGAPLLPTLVAASPVAAKESHLITIPSEFNTRYALNPGVCCRTVPIQSEYTKCYQMSMMWCDATLFILTLRSFNNSSISFTWLWAILGFLRLLLSPLLFPWRDSKLI